MSLLQNDIKTLHELLINKKVTSKELVDESIKLAKEYNSDYNFFVTINEDALEKEVTDNLLSGIPCAIKDNLSTANILSTGSSNTLKDYVPFFDATAVKKLNEANAVDIGKTVMDELGMGGTGTTGHTGIVRNPWDRKRITGGSSAGSAGAVAAGIVPYALGSDTGDSIRKPAAYCGIVGYKPTYGLVSRYGLFPFASSLDHVGCLTRNVYDAAVVIDQIKGQDEHDMTSLPNSTEKLVDSLGSDVSSKKLFYIKEICDINSYDEKTEELKKTLDIFKQTIDKCRDLGMTVEEVSIDRHLLEAIYPTYVCLSCAEATSNYSNLTGIVFGPRGKGNTINDIMIDHRTNGFSPLIKRRFIIGSYVLQQENQERYFKNAQRVRRLIVNKMNELFEKYDAMILPCSAKGARTIENNSEEIKTNDILENHMAIGNFGGFPSITIPNGFVDNMPIGINLTGKVLDDANILNIAYNIEKTMNYKNQIAKELV